ncbi:MAG: LuxR C-terminal-related transcriptional regulator [Acidimicrobiia bacterium]
MSGGAGDLNVVSLEPPGGDLSAQSTEVDSVPVVAHAKFVPPRLRAESVPRPLLVARVLSSGPQVVAITAPAGYGKSTLMAQSYAEAPLSVWYSADEGDNDPVVLWWSVTQAIGQVLEGFGGDYAVRLLTAGEPVVDDVVALLTNELSARGQPLHIFIDDVQRISSVASRRSLHRLATRLPDGTRLTLASREVPPLPLSRLRVEGKLVEIAGPELALSAEEGARLLANLDIHLDREPLESLIGRTEGWAAALQLVGLALVQSDDPLQFVTEFGGTDKSIAEYLVEEVLSSLSEEDAAFMIQTAPLARLSGELCDAVVDGTGSADRLRRLEATNALVIPLDRVDQWYRYHHLFADLLIARLSERDPAETREIHSCAFDWLSHAGEVGEAISHGLAAGRRRDAANLLCEQWWDFLNTGRLRTAQELLHRFDTQDILGYQPLAITAALIEGISGDLAAARRYIDAAGQATYEGEPLDGSANMVSSLAIARAVLALDGVDQARVDAETAYELEPPHSRFRQLAALTIGLALVMRGETTASPTYFAEAAMSDDPTIKLYALSELVLIHLAENDTVKAKAIADEACELMREYGLEDLVQAATALAATARVWIALGDTEQARSALAAADRPIRFAGNTLPMDLMHTLLLLAEASLAVGESDRARGHIERAAQIGKRFADTGTMVATVGELRSRLPPIVSNEVATEPDASAFTDRELEVLRLLPSGLTTRQIGEELFLSRNTIKTYLRRIYRVLEASSRSEAIERSRALGLLDDEEDPTVQTAGGGSASS